MKKNMWDRSKCVLFVSYTTGWCLYIAHVIGMVHNIIQPVSIQPLKSTMATNRRLAHFFSVKQQSIPGDGNHLEETCPKNFQWKQPCPAPPPPQKKKKTHGDYDLWTKFKMETFKAGELFPNKPLKVQSKTKRFDRRIGFFLSGD